jgi:chromosome segregation ATPase
MASEEHVDVSVRLPPDLEEWLDQQATDTDRSREDVLRELVAAYRSITEDETGETVVTEADMDAYASQEDVNALESTAVLDDALDEHRDEIDEQLDDIRKRVVQVKREADSKAASDHDHPALGERLDAVENDVTALSESVADVEDDLDSGFENFEDVLEYLTETTDDLEGKTGTLARVLVDVRAELKRLSAREARRAETEALQLAANREGVEAAKCDTCDAEVTIALLTAPECPQCASTFNDVEKRSGLFSSNQLVTGEPPALPEGRADDLDDDLAEELVEHVEDSEE